MRLHKEARTDAIPYFQILTNKQQSASKRPSWASDVFSGDKDNGVPEKYAFMAGLLMNFEREINALTEARDAIELLKVNAKKIIPIKDCAYFRYDEKTGNLYSSKAEKGTDISAAMQRFWKEGILQAVFDSKTSTMLPSLTNLNSGASALSYFVYPAYDGAAKTGLFVILTSVSKSNLKKFDKDILDLILSSTTSRLERISLRERLNSAYGDLQTYQAKLSNDFRLAAIGELTEGILEDIGTPLQVILSQVDLISAENQEPNELVRIRSQVVKIQQVIGRLVRFADVNQKQVEILPCNVNDLMKEYYVLVKSSLENLGMECALDLGKNLPPILTHPNYIFQILANVFGLLKSCMQEFGGVILQTRLEEEAVVLRITATADLSQFLKARKIKNENLNVRIINNFMKKHEGNFAIEGASKSGAIISLTFPIRRKIRQ